MKRLKKNAPKGALLEFLLLLHRSAVYDQFGNNQQDGKEPQVVPEQESHDGVNEVEDGNLLGEETGEKFPACPNVHQLSHSKRNQNSKDHEEEIVVPSSQREDNESAEQGNREAEEREEHFSVERRLLSCHDVFL